jgi:Uma2 family endonuclease
MSVMSLAPVPEWMFPPEGGFTADDLDHLPDLPPHTELIDGSLVLVSPQAHFHSLVLDVLVGALRRSLPRQLRVRREITVTLSATQRPEPDITVFESSTALTRTSIGAQGVVLVVEVVSPESRDRDRKRKPELYAEAGINHFWLVEDNAGDSVLSTYELDELTHAYVPTGIHHGSAKLTVPYPVEIDFGELDRL